jgi:hypothetical protein
MNASVHSQVFTSHEAGGLEIKRGIDDIRHNCDRPLCAVHTILSYCDETADVLKQVACQSSIIYSLCLVIRYLCIEGYPVEVFASAQTEPLDYVMLPPSKLYATENFLILGILCNCNIVFLFLPRETGITSNTQASDRGE